jgi:phosphohistidine phosphatase
MAQVLGLTQMASPIRKGSVWWVRSKSKDDSMQATLHAVMSPELL